MPQRRRRARISGKSVLVIGGISLLVVLGYDKYKHSTSGPVAGARPGTIAP